MPPVYAVHSTIIVIFVPFFSCFLFLPYCTGISTSNRQLETAAPRRGNEKESKKRKQRTKEESKKRKKKAKRESKEESKKRKKKAKRESKEESKKRKKKPNPKKQSEP